MVANNVSQESGDDDGVGIVIYAKPRSKSTLSGLRQKLMNHLLSKIEMIKTLLRRES